VAEGETVDNLNRKLSLLKPRSGSPTESEPVPHPPPIVGVATTSQSEQLLSVKITVTQVRKEINSLCKDEHTRALAWCLHVHAGEPKMEVENLFEWLDEIGCRPPPSQKKKPRFYTWAEYHASFKGPAQDCVSNIRRLLRKHNVPHNHS
jgi:hypothetical protein